MNQRILFGIVLIILGFFIVFSEINEKVKPETFYTTLKRLISEGEKCILSDKGVISCS